jgi:NTE family protein
VGLALGGGAARGWAHVGVIRTLEQAGIRADVVCGTSIGALVGAAYAAGELDRFERWVLGMGITDVVGFMDLSLGGGLLKGDRVMEFFRRNFADHPIDQLALPFGSVATALNTGAEVWLRDGSTVDAVRASIALPGFLTPVVRDGAVLVDGGLVNPVPVSLARAMGAEFVIAVDLNSDRRGSREDDVAAATLPDSLVGEWIGKLQQKFAGLFPAKPADQFKLPSMQDVLFTSIDIMQDRITRSRLAGEPPDCLVAPRLAHLHIFDFHRAKDAIEAGNRAVQAVLPSLQARLERTG